MARYGSVAWMLRNLDREEVDRNRNRCIKRQLRKIHDARLRHFAQALVHEILHDPECHEWNIREKVISRRKIGRASYFLYLRKLDETLLNVPYVEGRINRSHQQHQPPTGKETLT